MIYDKTANWENYFPKNKIWNKVFAFIQKCSVATAPGRYEIDGEDACASVFSYDTKPQTSAVYEAHRRKIDIQLLLAGRELIHVADIGGLAIKTAYEAEKDCAFYDDPPWLPGVVPLTVGCFAVFFPNDAHKPGINYAAVPENVKKIVVKLDASRFP